MVVMVALKVLFVVVVVIAAVMTIAGFHLNRLLCPPVLVSPLTLSLPNRAPSATCLDQVRLVAL